VKIWVQSQAIAENTENNKVQATLLARKKNKVRTDNIILLPDLKYI
jgi:hypothetical protein